MPGGSSAKLPVGQGLAAESAVCFCQWSFVDSPVFHECGEGGTHLSWHRS